MNLNSIEEIIADERFLAWYFKNDENKAKEWENWLIQHPENKVLAEQSIAWLQQIEIKEKEPASLQLEDAHKKLQASLHVAPVIEMKPKSRRWWMPAAAAAVILLIAGFFYWNNQEKTTLDSTYGMISEYELPDGSQVTLNANSQVTMNKKWEEGTDREVWLKGEAFFKVQKTELKNKFIVHTNNMDIIVTGTQFNAVSRDDESSILLTEGSVTIRTPDGKEVHMKPGDFVKIENNTPSKATVDQERVLAWKQAKLDFENTPMNEVAKVISRHYGVKVSLPDKAIAEKTISGMMPNDNLDVLISALEATGEYKITKINNEIIISGQ